MSRLLLARRRSLPPLFGCFLLLVAAAESTAAVRLEVLPDGRKIIHNRGSAGNALAPAPRVGRRSRASLVSELSPAVERHAARTGLDPALVHAVIATESAYDPRAVSRKGAMGLMQLMPATARDLAVSDAFDTEQNLRGGTDYLRAMLERFDGRVELALAAYNAGPSAVERFGGVPPYPETRSYVARVLTRYRGGSRASYAASGFARRGRPTYLTRDGRGRLVITTTRPAAR